MTRFSLYYVRGRMTLTDNLSEVRFILNCNRTIIQVK